LSHGTCSYIRMYINAVAALRCAYSMVFVNIIFKIKHKLYIASGTAPPPQWKILGARLPRPDVLSLFRVLLSPSRYSPGRKCRVLSSSLAINFPARSYQLTASLNQHPYRPRVSEAKGQAKQRQDVYWAYRWLFKDRRCHVGYRVAMVTASRSLRQQV
jgi:hypothetical protein